VSLNKTLKEGMEVQSSNQVPWVSKKQFKGN